MAFGNAAIWEINAGGSDTANGGGFDPLATFATDLAATSANTSAPVVTSASYNFISRDVGAWLFVSAGTNWTPGLYQIASVASNAATLSAAIGAGILYANFAPSAVSTAAGCATAASPTSGTWAIDYSRGTSPAIAYTDMVIGATTTQFTSAGNPVGPHIVGNLIRVTAGSGFTVQTVEVVSVSGTTATCDKTLGTTASTGGTAGLGGALASIGKVVNVAIAGNTVFVAAPGTYNLSSSSNANGGEINGGNVAIWVGYNTTRTINNTDAIRPLFNATAANRSLVQLNSGQGITNWDFNANGQTGCTAFNGSALGIRAVRCTANGFNIGFTTGNNGVSFFQCYATGCITGYAPQNSGNNMIGCVAVSGTTGFIPYIGGVCADCIAANNSSYGFTIASAGNGAIFLNCSAYNNGTTSGANFQMPANTTGTCINCIAYTNNTYNYVIHANAIDALINCAGGNATTANIQYASGSSATGNQTPGFIALSANPFSSVSTDFSLNTTSGGGAACRAAGVPAAFIGLSTTTSHIDLGAVQHPDPSVTAGATAWAY